MPSLKMVGPVPTAANSVATRQVTDSQISGLITPATMQSRVDSAAAALATKSYVDTQDGNFTTKAYVDQQDALYMPNSWRGAPNGVAEMVNGIVPFSRIPKVPTYPVWHARTWRYTDFTSNVVAGTGGAYILDTTMNMSTNGTYWRYMVFANFEGWAISAAAPANNLNGKPFFRVYVNGYLVGQSAGRNGAGSGASSPASVTPVTDDNGHTPGSGFTQSSVSVRVLMSSTFTDTAVTYAPTPQTLLTIIGIGI